jgi:hypothetical protein
MFIFDLIVMPLGCLFCGILASASLLSRYIPRFHVVKSALLPYKNLLGLITVFSSIVSLILPVSGPSVFGSFFPAVFGILVGGLFTIELLLNSRIGKNKKELISRIGNALLFLKWPIGLFAIFFGLMHLIFNASPFF